MLREIYSDADELHSATAFLGTSRAVCHITAQGASGLLVFLGSPAWCFAINGVSFAVLAVSVLRSTPSRLPVAAAGAKAQESFLTQLGDGFKAVADRPQFAWALSNYAVAWLMIVQPFLVLAPAALLVASPDGGSLIWGFLGGAIGIGGILGGVLSGRIGTPDRLTFVVLLGLFDVPIYILLALAPTNMLIYPLAVITGVQSTLARIILNQELYRRIPEELISRVQSLLLAAWLLPAFVASIAAPLLAEAIGFRPVLLGGAGSFVVINLFMALNVWRHAEHSEEVASDVAAGSAEAR
ncbi:MFS transporter [Nocardioides sp. InS609-2]|uniref:MFS transporter n=1 Tax=Nocardioides sp. InS609-2 TaxID=2760705 RepID=UPI0024A62F0B|nr:MFS transporter [Nocardioides sp. InS609-2]